MRIPMTEFDELQALYEKKRKNEQAVPAELLQTKYRKSYEQLCESLKEKQCELRMFYMSRIRELSNIADQLVYEDFNQEDSYEWLMERCDQAYKKYHDPFMKQLLIGLQNGFGGGKQNEKENT